MPASSFYKFNIFVLDLGLARHNLNASDSLQCMLLNALPAATDSAVDTTTGTCTCVGSGAAEIAVAAGYTKKGFLMTSVAWAQVAGVAKLTAAVVTWTAGASIGPFQYAVIFNDTKGTTATRPIICWFNYGSAITLGIGETFTIGNSNDGTAWTTTYPILSLT
jgi:hypothetical protein